MAHVTIMETERFHLVSLYNGLAYDLWRNDGKGNVFVQDDDAAIFRADLDALESADPERSSDSVLGELFAMYTA